MTKEKSKLSASVRTITGKKVRQLRKQGLMPSSVYGHGFEPVSIQINEKEMAAIFAHAGESGLVELELDGKALPILFRNPQYHPVTGLMTHIDCYKVNLKEKITTFVPIEFVGESEAVKLGNVLVEAVNEIEVEALPTDLPEKIEVDLAKLVTLDSEITVADLIVDRSKIEIKNDPEQVVVKVEEPKVEVEPVVEETTEVVVAPAMNQKTEEEKAADDAKKAEEKKKEEKDK
ncbi:MAG: 50S ribosomal protein L25 [Microgenomates group bacterium]